MAATGVRDFPVIREDDKLNLKMIEAADTVAYDDTSVSLFSVPANTIIVAIVVKVSTGFTMGAHLGFGDGSSSELYGYLEGALGAAGTYVLWPIYEEATSTVVTATLSTVGEALAAGEASVWLVYRPFSLDTIHF